MRLKELDKTANMAWSPAQQHPVYIATGTAAQQLDATFRYAYEYVARTVHHNPTVQSQNETFESGHAALCCFLFSSTTASLELYKVDWADPSLKMEKAGSIETDCRCVQTFDGSDVGLQQACSQHQKISLAGTPTVFQSCSPVRVKDSMHEMPLIPALPCALS